MTHDSVPVLCVASQAGDPCKIKIIGQADFHNRCQIRGAFEDLMRLGYAAFEVDLNELDYADSSTISTLVNCAIRAGEAGGYIKLIGANRLVERALTLCGAVSFFGSSVGETAQSIENTPVPPSSNYWRVSDFSLPARPEAAAQARARIGEVIKTLPIPLKERQDILIAAGEALANAIKHGCRCNPDLRISVKCIAGPHSLEIEITDPGGGFNPNDVEKPLPRSLREGGMGIHMMRELMDEVVFSFDGATSAKLTKHIHQTPSSLTAEPGVSISVLPT